MHVNRKSLFSLPNRSLIEGSFKEMVKITPHPEWVEEFLDFVKPYKDRVVNNRFFTDIINGNLSLSQFRGALINFYPLIETFPLYMGLNLAKVPAGNSSVYRKTRYWLITNINIERLHTDWWREFAAGFKVSREDLDEEIFPPPEMDAINNYLWRISTHGSLAEGISAVNFAIEGPTGEWTRTVREGLGNYRNAEGVEITKRTLEWVEAHASYDDMHPFEALEIIKFFATTKEEQMKVRQAAKRSLEYYALALDACYEIYK
jgi:pyrroloquinoline quinone (PQQ) biosynthesis protein C